MSRKQGSSPEAGLEPDLTRLLSNAACSAGWALESVSHEGDRTLLAVRREDLSFTAWVRAASDEPCFARSGAWSVGYRGELPRGGDLLLQHLAAALAAVPTPPPEVKAGPTLIFGTDQLEIRVTLACNEHCVFCNSWLGADNLTVDLASAVSLLEQARSMGTRKLVISGGEPLLVPWLPQLTAEARRLGFSYICLQTNAVQAGLAPSRLRRPHPRLGQGIADGDPRSDPTRSAFPADGPLSPSDAPWALLEATAPDEVLVSAHGSTPDVLAAVTRRSDLARAHLDGLIHLLESGFRVIVNFVVCRQNVEDLPRFVEFLARQSRPPFLLSVSFVAPIGLAWENRNETMLRYSDAAAAVLSALRLARDLGLQAVLPEFCGIPTCVLPELREFADPADEKRPIHVPPDKTAIPACGNCPWKPRCSGVFRRYLEMFGGI